MPTLQVYTGRRREPTISAALPVSRDGRQILNRNWWPVVLVPGIMGSRVEQTNGRDRIWDPDRTRFMLWLMTQSPDSLTRLYNHRLTPGRTMRTIYDSDNAELDPNRDRGERMNGISRTDRNWASVSWKYYGDGAVGIQRDIAPTGGVLWCFGYDWRRSNLDNGRLLKQFINDTVRPTSRFKPIIVTHSMGGLVTRAACAPPDGMESMVSGVIHTMMPTYGAAEAYGSPKHGRMSFPFKYLVGNSQLEIACVTSGVTGMFELMPNSRYPDRSWLTIDPQLESRCDPPGPYQLSQPHRLYKEANGLLGLVRHETFNANVVNVGGNRYVQRTRRVLRHILDNIDSAESYHERRVRDYCHPMTWLIAGNGRETVERVTMTFHQPTYRGINLRPEAHATLIRTRAGDATVPLTTARVLENHPNCKGGFIVAGDFDHAESTNNRVVIQAIGDLIRRIRNAGLQRW